VEPADDETKGDEVMRTMLLGLTVAMGLTMGCAHGTLVTGAPTDARDVRGSTRVGRAARLIVAGPARLVHATGEKPVQWFVADRVSGGDGDCTAARAAARVLSESTRTQVTIAPGHVLCAVVASGATDVMWHQFVAPTDNMWALR
jgi:hypothetical protein